MATKRKLTTSEFYLWRVLMALAWADGDFGDEEMDFFTKVINNLVRYYDMGEDQRDTLADDLENAKKVEDLVPHIQDSQTKDLLLSYARELVSLDGVIDPSEQEILDRLHLSHKPGYDESALRAETREFLFEKREERVMEQRLSPTKNRQGAAMSRLFEGLGFGGIVDD